MVLGTRFDHGDRIWRDLLADMRLAKAGYIYADTVEVASTTVTEVLFAIDGVTELIARSHGRDRFDLEVTGAVMKFIASQISTADENALRQFVAGVNAGAFEPRRPLEAGVLAGSLCVGKTQDAVIPLFGADYYATVIASPEGQVSERELRGVLSALEKLLTTSSDETTLSAYGKLADHVRRELRRPVEQRKTYGPPVPSRESHQLSQALGKFPAFPDADWDVLVDVRSRLGNARVRLRAAILDAARNLGDPLRTDFSQEMTSLRTRIIDPALLDIEEALRELGAIPTLLRVSSDAAATGGLIGNLALLAAAPESLGASIILHAAVSAPVIATMSREIAARRAIRRTVSVQPYWTLLETERAARGKRKRLAGGDHRR